MSLKIIGFEDGTVPVRVYSTAPKMAETGLEVLSDFAILCLYPSF